VSPIPSHPYSALPDVSLLNTLAQAPAGEVPPSSFHTPQPGNVVEQSNRLQTSANEQQGSSSSDDRGLSSYSRNNGQPHSSNTAETHTTTSSTGTDGAGSSELGSNRSNERLSPPPEFAPRDLSAPEPDEPQQHPPYIEGVTPDKGPTSGGLRVVVVGDNFPSGPIYLRFGGASARAVSNHSSKMHILPILNFACQYRLDEIRVRCTVISQLHATLALSK
jgi:hypothetical protein